MILLFLFSVPVSRFSYLCGQYNEFFIFLFMYLLGRYMCLYPVEIFVNNSISIWMLSILILLLDQYLHLSEFGFFFESTYYVPSYNNPLSIIAAVSFFFIFYSIKLGTSKIINKIAEGVLAVYLLTDGVLRMSFNSFIANRFGQSIVMLILLSFIVVFLISFIDIFRRKIFERINSFFV